MKVVTSNCEAQFINRILSKGCRTDGRGLQDGRPMEITFGKSFGCCIVLMENTRALAQVSCELTAPRPARPAEGILNVNFELSPMAAPNFESGRLSEAGVEATRLLERGVRDSKCVDLESLCVVAGSKVWRIRVDVQALNNGGNLIECASIATIAALSHFKRPYVSVIGTDVTVHSLDDHLPVPLTMRHMPIIVNLAVFKDGGIIVVDPLDIEERVAEGKVVIGVNAHQEICSYHLNGIVMLKKDSILRCSNIAVKRAQLVTQKIRSALDNDSYKRATNQQVGFVSLLQGSMILGAKHPIRQITVPKDMVEDDPDVKEEEGQMETDLVEDDPQVIAGPSKIVGDVQRFLEGAEKAVFEGGSSKWCLDEEDSASSDSDDEAPDFQHAVKKEKDSSNEADSSSSSEEEQKVFLKSDSVPAKPSRGWYTKYPCT